MLRRLLKGISNRSAAGPDRVTWRLIKLAMHTPLRSHLTRHLASGVKDGGSKEWWDSRIVLLPKPGRDLSKANSWRPISLINMVSKWVDKWVAEDIQTEGQDLLHDWQMGSRKWRSAQDALARLLV